MRISHQHRFVFLSNPQSGSTSIRTALDPYSEIKSSAEFPYHHHTNARKLKEHFEEQGWDWERYFKFTTVRNPWDRMVARYYYGLSNPKSVWHKPATDAGSFAKFLDHPMILKSSPNSTLQVFAYSTEGTCLVDEILKLEELQDSWPSVIKKLGLEEAKLPHINKRSSRNRPASHRMWEAVARVRNRLFQRVTESTLGKMGERSHYSTFYNDVTRDRVANWFSFDIELVGYRFEVID